MPTEMEWSGRLATRSGFAFDVRPVAPSDEDRLATFFAHVTAKDLRFRFLDTREIGADEIRRMILIDHDLTEGFLALAPEDGAVIASAMLAIDPARERGEVAIAIRPEYKQRGVSWSLLEHVTRYAEARGLRVIESIESRANQAAITLEQEMGFTSSPVEGEPTLVLVQRRLG